MDRFQIFENGLEEDYWMRSKMNKEKPIGILSKKERPQFLSNLEKGRFFKDSVSFFTDWKKLSQEEKDGMTPTEKVGIYCIVFSMLEDRLETFWWNCSYVHGWNVIGEWDVQRQEFNTKDGKGHPPSKFGFKNRKIPRGIRTTGVFRIQLLQNGKINQKLHDRIEDSEYDRKELIHRNMYFKSELMDKHIVEVMNLFREVDKLLQKNKKGHSDLLGLNLVFSRK